MRIGIVGSGNMGRSLGVLFAERGHTVFFGARRVEQGQAAAKLAGRDASFGTNSEAAQFGEVIVWTVRDVPVTEVIENTRLLDGKPVIDMSNQPKDEALRPGRGSSMAEQLQAQMPCAHVVKAFNSLSIELLELAPTPIDQPEVSVFVASDDTAAKHLVEHLICALGFVPVDCGDLSSARVLESLGDLMRIIISQGHPLTVAISIADLPSALTQRLGGRQPSRLS